MSAAVVPASVPLTSLGLDDQLCTLLSELYGKCRGYVPMIAGRGSGSSTYRHPVAAGFRLLPMWLLRELTYQVPDDLRLGLATTDEGGARLVDAPAVWVEIPLQPTFSRQGREGYAWRVPPAELDAATAKLGSFALPMSVLVDGHDSLACVWLLTEPVPLDCPELRRMEALQRALAEALGGRLVDASEARPRRHVRRPGEPLRTAALPAWHPRRQVLRLPGSRNRSRGLEGHPVALVRADLSARYTLDQIEDALKPAAAPAKKARKA